tara:strand:+ start:931 stop:1323 length:393 start_codon:yes stop_codon:yes gene_type:complete
MMSDKKYPFKPNWMNKEHLFHLHEFMVEIRKLHEKLDRQWISVDDRLPDSHGRYLTSTEKAFVKETYFCQNEKGKALWTKDYGKVRPTHWMPLPEPPTGGEQIPFVAIGNGEPVPPQLKPIIEKLNDTSK